MLTLLLGRGGSRQKEAILDRVAASTLPRRVILVPEQYSHEMERALCRAAGDSASLHTEVLSFTRLGRRVADTAGGGAERVLDAGGRMLLMYAALQGVADSLTVYRQPSRRPAFLTGLLATVDECKTCRVPAAALVEAGEDIGGSEGDKLRDIGLIYGAYEAMTEQLARDPRDSLTRLGQGLEESGWARGVDLYLWGFSDFTPQEREVLRVLMDQAARVTAALTCDLEDPGEIFTTTRRTAEQLREMARRAGTPCRVETLPLPEDRHPGLAHLERELFAQGAAPWPGPCPVELYAARDPRGEVERTAGEILRLVREEGLRFRDIAVTARDFSVYGDLVESVFPHYGIPVFLNTMTDILRKSVPALVTGALDAIGGGYRYEDIFRFLKTGLTSLPQEDRDILENYVRTWNIRGSRWTREWDMHPGGYGQEMTPADRAELERLNAMRRQVMAPLEELRTNPDRTGAGRARAVYHFLEQVDMPGCLERRVEELRALGELKSAGEYEQLWDILVDGLEQCAGLLGDQVLDDQQFAHLFSLVLSQYDVGTIPVSLDRVSAGEGPRMVNKEAQVLFFLGADSDALPRVAPAPGLLTDLDRDRLALRSLELGPRAGEKLHREMALVYRLCTLPTCRLVVSWAETGGEKGGEKRPSFLVERLEALFPGAARLQEGQLGGDFRLSAPAPALEEAGRRSVAAKALKRLPGWRERVEALERAGRWRRGMLSLPAVEALYGPQVGLSATKLDQLRSCHFSHFMKYGLRARPRETAAFQASHYGTFVHSVLEEVLREGIALPGGVAGLARDGALRDSLARRAAERYARETLGGLEGETRRFCRLFQRMEEAVLRVVENVVEELACSQFQPVAFELGFGRDERGLPAVEAGKKLKVRLGGYVDRVDCWVHGGRRYLRVVDYKTGKKAFDFTDIKHGRGLQMLLYLFALEEKGQTLFGEEEIVPAGVLYLPARDAVASGSRDTAPEEVRRKLDSQLRRKGLLLDDQEVLEAMEPSGEGGRRFLPVGGRNGGESLASPRKMAALRAHVRRELENVAGELERGDIAADPYWRGSEDNACRYCDYRSACHFEESCGDQVSWQRAVSSAQFWGELLQTLEEEEEDHGHETH